MNSSNQSFETMFAQEIASLSSDLQNPLQTLAQITTAILLSFALALAVCLVYRQTHRGLQYSRSFVFTLALLAPIVSVIMVVVEGSLARAFAVLGALSLVRFRTAVKDTTDLAYVFWAITVGLCVGTNHHLTAVAATVLIAIAIGILSWSRFGAGHSDDYVLRFSVDSNNGAESHYQQTFKKMLKKATLLDMHALSKGAGMDVVYAVSFNNANGIQPFVQELSNIQGVERVGLINSKEEVES